MKKFFISVLVVAIGAVLTIVFFSSPAPQHRRGCPALACISTKKVEWSALDPVAQQGGGLREYSICATEQESGLRHFNKVSGTVIRPRADC